jgi:tRNA pseudouridine55 synthase
MYGILNLNKPAGATSRDVVNHVQRMVKPAKAGHAGTLDPLATGVLVVCVGPATRLIEYVQRMPKRYTGTFLLGRRSETDDVEGTVVELDAPPVPSREQIESALKPLTGVVLQRPPAYSALKVAGQRAYALARRGEDVQLAPREVEIHGLQVVEYAYPRLVLNVACGSGTYVRAVGRDLAESLGTAAVMSALVRTAVGGYTIEDAASPDEITRDSVASRLLPALSALGGMPTITLGDEEHRRISNGLSIEHAAASVTTEYAALTPDGQLAAILVSHQAGELRPSRVLLSSQAG